MQRTQPQDREEDELPVQRAMTMVREGILFALDRKLPRATHSDILDAGLSFYNAVVHEQFVTLIAACITPKGKPPNVKDILDTFNGIMLSHGEVIDDIRKYANRFHLLLQTLTEKSR